jgi:PAS domain S-box-containing protein
MARERTVLSEVIEQIEDAVIVVDEDFNILVLNASARALFALPESNVIGRPIMDLVEHVGLVRMVAEPSSADADARVEQDLSLSNGHLYRARVTLVEGGSRFITLRRLN